MRPIASEEILPFEQWERLRPRLRPLFIREKERRRLAVGPQLTLLFENGATVWYQIEEMLRAERLSSPEAIRHELETYNELIPAAGELSATLLIEIPDPRERDAALSRLVGLDRHMRLRVGERRMAARFDARQSSGGRISAVQFIRFPLPDMTGDTFLKLARAGQAAVEADHPALTARGSIFGAVAAALAEDLAGEENAG